LHAPEAPAIRLKHGLGRTKVKPTSPGGQQQFSHAARGPPGPRGLKQLRRFLRGAPATVVWDNLPSQHSHVMGAWLGTQRHWLAVEFLPGYPTS
jgi:hypothetical protein